MADTQHHLAYRHRLWRSDCRLAIGRGQLGIMPSFAANAGDIRSAQHRTFNA